MVQHRQQGNVTVGQKPFIAPAFASPGFPVARLNCSRTISLERAVAKTLQHWEQYRIGLRFHTGFIESTEQKVRVAGRGSAVFVNLKSIAAIRQFPVSPTMLFMDVIGFADRYQVSGQSQREVCETDFLHLSQEFGEYFNGRLRLD